MMPRILIIVLALLVAGGCSNSAKEVRNTKPPDHAAWTKLLSKHVDEDGMVDYDRFLADSLELHKYLGTLSANPPSEEWTKRQKLAYWINVYNAFTIDLVLKHYPLTSIKDIGSSIQIPFINSPWDIEFFEIGGVEYDLNAIEHDILRKELYIPW
jgi:hypothetical protein